MADYWKSQPKKFCDFCKCWIADNRPSVEFHEKGKRHKENVEKRLKEMGKKSFKDHKANVKVESQMKKMEDAAMKAYLKDIEEGRDYSAQEINRKAAAEEEARPKWQAVKTEEGHVYYWLIGTEEVAWEPPVEGFIPLEEPPLPKIVTPEDVEEERARLQREANRVYAVKEEDKELFPFEEVPLGPEPRTEPYGAWRTVRAKGPVDYQLPQSRHETVEIRVPTLQPKKEVMRFKEKTFQTGREGDKTDFKKRKAAAGAQRNMRKRLDVD